MPYIIAVLALIVVGVGFTLFQSQPQPTDVATTESTSTIEKIKDIVVEEVYEIADATTTAEDIIEDEATSSDTTSTTPPPIAAETVAPNPGTATPEPTPTTPIPTPTPEPAIVYDYRNGTYSSHISYRTPDGTYAMDVSLTINGDKVTTANITFDSKASRDSYTKRFNNSYQSYVVGKDLDSVNLSRVGGASLTSAAFNKAVAAIKTQANA